MARTLYKVGLLLLCFWIAWTVLHLRSALDHGKKSVPSDAQKQELSEFAVKKEDGCKTIPESSDPEEVEERERSYLQYLDTVKKYTKQDRTKKLPGLIGIGAEKCGTDAMRRIITRNPLVVASTPTELHFFDDVHMRNKGADAYIDLMPEVMPYQIIMEKTPAYLIGHSDLPKRMHAIVPNAKIFVILCDPTPRTISDFVHEKIHGHLPEDANYDTLMVNGIKEMRKNLESMEFSEMLTEKYVLKESTGNAVSHIIAGGLYLYHLKRWFQVFNRSQIMVIDGEDLINRPWEVAREMQDFLGIPRLVVREDFAKNPETDFFQVEAAGVIRDRGRARIQRVQAKCKSIGKKSRTRNGAWDYEPKLNTLALVRQFYAEFDDKLFSLVRKRLKW